MKQILKMIPLVKSLSARGLFSKSKRKAFVTNFIFQRIFRINSDSPWSVNYTSRVICPENITLGEGSERNFLFSTGCYIQANNGIKIGKNVWWGPNVGIVSANHDSENMHGHVKSNPIVLGDGVWVGMNSVILPGVELGNDVVVGAGSVVTKSFPENVVIAGNPAEIIKENHDKKERK